MGFSVVATASIPTALENPRQTGCGASRDVGMEFRTPSGIRSRILKDRDFMVPREVPEDLLDEVRTDDGNEAACTYRRREMLPG